MSDHVDPGQLYEWCRVPAEELVSHPALRVRFRMVEDAHEMGRLMAQELVELVAARNAENRPTRVIAPCGPIGWYAPWTEMVNARGVSLARLTVFHMDECLDWQGRPLPKDHPYNFRTFMERHFYGGIRTELNVPEAQLVAVCDVDTTRRENAKACLAYTPTAVIVRLDRTTQYPRDGSA